MSAVLDTHAIVWYLLDSEDLPPRVSGLIDKVTSDGATMFVSAISLVEVAYLVERGRIPADAFEQLAQALRREDSAFAAVPVDLEIAEKLKTVPRDAVPDMPDRIIAATAIHLGVPLITRDRRLQAAGIETIW